MRDAPWATVHLDDCVADDRPICYGILMPGRGHPGGIPVIKVKDIKNGRVLLDDILLTSPEIDAQYKRSRVRAGDVLLTIRGTTGRVARVPEVLDGANITQDTARVATKDGVDGDFLFFVLQSEAVQAEVQNNTRGQAVKGINIADVRRLRVPLPPESEQRKIATILSAVDNAVDATQAIINQLQVVKKAMMTELLTRGLPGQHTRFEQTEIGESPEGWDLIRLSDVASVVRGSTPRPARDPRYFGGSAVPWITVGELSKDDWPYLTAVSTGLTEAGRERSRFLHEGTVVLSNSGFGCGVPKVLQISGCANDGIAAFLDLRRLEPLFLYYTLASMTEFLRGTVARGVEQPNLNTTLIGDLHVRCPPISEQQAIAEFLFGLDVRLRTERDGVAALARVKQSLMSALLTGEVRVTHGEVAA